MGTPILEVKGLSFGYGGAPFFKDISFTVRRGDFIFLLGENGSGKSTLMRLLCGILNPLAGDIKYQGKKLSQYTRRELARYISLAGDEVPQDFPLIVRDYVSLGVFPRRGFFGVFSDEDRRDVEESMEQMGISPLSERYLHELSSGERQRALLAKALVQQGELLLFDEPGAHLDLRNSLQIFSILNGQVDEGKTVIVSSHDPNITGRFGRSVLLLKGGKIVSFGKGEEVLTEWTLRDAFGIEVRVDRNPLTGTPRITIVE